MTTTTMIMTRTIILFLLVTILLPYNSLAAANSSIAGDYVLYGITDTQGTEVEFPEDEGPFRLKIARRDDDDNNKNSNNNSNNKNKKTSLYSISIKVSNSIWTTAEISENDDSDNAADTANALVVKKMYEPASTRMMPFTEKQAILESTVGTMLSATKTIQLKDESDDEGNSSSFIQFVGNKGTLTFQNGGGNKKNAGSSSGRESRAEYAGRPKKQTGVRGANKKNKKPRRKKNKKKMMKRKNAN